MVKIHPEFQRDTESQIGTHDGTHKKPRGELIIDAIKLTRKQIVQKIGISKRTVSRELEKLK